jgi:tetratricopeptide (TPR) repeat protein
MAEEHEPEIELSPRLEALSEEYAKDPTSRKFLPLAEEYRKSRMYEEAIYICKEGLKHHPGFVQALLTLARCQLEIKQYEDAQNTLRDIIDRNPENPSANKMLGEILVKKGDFEQARSLFLKAKQARPGDVEIDRMLKQIDGTDESRPESVEISSSEDLHVDREELLHRTALDWVDPGSKRGRDESFGKPETEQVFATGPAIKPVDLYGTKKEEELDLSMSEADLEAGLELSLGDEEEVPSKRESLEEEEPVETLEVMKQDEIDIRKPAYDSDSFVEDMVGEHRLVSNLEEVEGIEVVATEPDTELDRTVRRVREEFIEPEPDLSPEVDFTGTETLDTTGEAKAEGESFGVTEGIEVEQGSSEGEGITVGAVVESKIPEKVTVFDSSEAISPEDAQDAGVRQAEVIELDDLSEDELKEFPAAELELSLKDVIKEGRAPEGLETGTTEESLREEKVAVQEAGEEMAFELGDDFVLEGVEVDLTEDAIAAPSVDVEPVEIAVEADAEGEKEAVEAEEELAPSTMTAAAIYEEQGHLKEALSIYQKLLESEPGDQELAGKVEELRQRLAGERAVVATEKSVNKIEILSGWLRNIEAFRRKVQSTS